MLENTIFSALLHQQHFCKEDRRASVVTVAPRPSLSPYSWTEEQQVVSQGTSWTIPPSLICPSLSYGNTLTPRGEWAKVSVHWRSQDRTIKAKQRGKQREEVESWALVRLSCAGTPPETQSGFSPSVFVSMFNLRPGNLALLRLEIRAGAPLKVNRILTILSHIQTSSPPFTICSQDDE